MNEKVAVLQFEVDRQRWFKGPFVSAYSSGEDPKRRLEAIAKTAAMDTLQNGGTFVLVVTDTKITMVQRADAEQIDNA